MRLFRLLIQVHTSSSSTDSNSSSGQARLLLDTTSIFQGSHLTSIDSRYIVQPRSNSNSNSNSNSSNSDDTDGTNDDNHFVPLDLADYRAGPIEISFWSTKSSSKSMPHSNTKECDAQQPQQTAPLTGMFIPSSSLLVSSSTSASDQHHPEPEEGKSTSYSFEDDGSVKFRHGVLHVYRDIGDVSHSSLASGSSEGVNAEGLRMVALLAIPAYFATSDLLSFLAPFRHAIEHLRLLYDSQPNRYMGIIRFRTPRYAAQFMRQYNGRPFSSMEPEICNAVYLASIDVIGVDSALIPAYGLPALLKTQTNEHGRATDLDGVMSYLSPIEPSDGTSGSGGELVSAELPTCPVCLERMDHSVTGLMTILCQHSFHCSCLSQWMDGSCPVCRHSQQTRMSPHLSARDGAREPRTSSVAYRSLSRGRQHHHDSATASSPSSNSTCSVCHGTSSLWMCLICGNVGCGRYEQGHAVQHFRESGHLYAMELGTQRVWDYVGDGYVHRLVQNASDGKLIEIPAPTSFNRAISSSSQAAGGYTADRRKLSGSGDKHVPEYVRSRRARLQRQRQAYEAIASRHSKQPEPKRQKSLSRKMSDPELYSNAMSGKSGWIDSDEEDEKDLSWYEHAEDYDGDGDYTGDGNGDDGGGNGPHFAAVDSYHRRIEMLTEEVEMLQMKNASATERIDEISMEYSRMVAQQLHEQRVFFEQKLDAVMESLARANNQISDAVAKSNSLDARVKAMSTAEAQLQTKIASMEQSHAAEIDALQIKLEKAARRVAALEKELADERAMNEAMRTNRATLEKQLEEERRNTADLQDQLNDMMTFISNQDKLANDPELRAQVESGQAATRTIPSKPSAATKKGGRRR